MKLDSKPEYDALLVVSFGGPEGMDDIMPFLENVLRGRNIPADRVREVAKHYEMFGGISPINEQNRKLIAALTMELETGGPQLPIYWGNRNWHPLLPATLSQMKTDGIKRALAFVTSAYSSYSSCRQYLENIANAREIAGAGAPEVQKIRAYYNHPLFVEANVENVRAALDTIPDERRRSTSIAFTAHSIPQKMADNCEYEGQLLETSRLVAEALGHASWQLVYQSRSGPASQPWLGPDICEYLKELQHSGATDAVIAPIGFVSDHMEIIYDLDTQARQLCEAIGLNMVRAATVSTHAAFIRMIRELIVERMNPDGNRSFLGTRGASHDVCFPSCCMSEVGVEPAKVGGGPV